ncbi:hypothetical protein Tco_1306880 [Tanacetum coccineum]
MIVQDTIQLNIVEQKSHDDLEAEQNVEKVKKHLAAEEIEKIVEGAENEEEYEFVNSVLDSQNDPGTRLDPGSYKESPEIKGRYGYLFGHLKTASMPRKSFHELANYLQEFMQDSLPSMVDSQVKEVTKTTVLVYVAEGLILERQKMQAKVAQMVADAIQSERENIRAEFTSQINNAITNQIPSQDNHHDDAHPEGENSAKRQKISEHGTYVFRESSSSQANRSEPGPSTSGNQEQLDDFDFWMDKYATDDDELPAEKVSQGTCGRNPSPVVQSCQRDPKAHALSLVNQDLLYLKKGNSGSMKYVLSLHKFLVVIFPNDGIEERTSRWVDKCVNKFNPYARYSVEHWKNPHAKIFYIKRQKEPGNPIEEVYSNSKIVQVIETTGELGHEHKFVTKIIVRRAIGGFSSITEPDYKNLNKNDIEDMYMLCVNGKVDDYAETGLLWSLSVFIKSIVIWERVHDLQLGVESYQ